MNTSKARHTVSAKYLALAAACTCLAAPAAHAITYVEVGDAGQTIGTAQAVAGPGAIDAIRGSLLTSSSTDRADLFAIYLTAGQAFSATTTASSLAFNDFDTTLFLFSGSGLGLLASDDDAGPQSTISGFMPSTSGVYYLGIAGAGYNPISAGGSIFPVLSGGGQFGPTGPGGGQPLIGWNSTTSEGDAYEVRLTGVLASAVPEPASAWTLLAGLMVCGAHLARRRNAAAVNA